MKQRSPERPLLQKEPGTASREVFIKNFFFLRIFLFSLLGLFVASSLILPSSSKALTSAFEEDEGISETSLRESIQKNSSLTTAQIDALIAGLRKQLGVESGQKIPIQGYLYTHGMNVALFVDHDAWTFDATLRTPGSEQLVDIPDLFICDFKNGGLKAEVAYKWMFTFIPRGANVDDIDGGVYGRGVGGVLDAFLGFEASWLPAQNRPHDMLHIGLKLGFGAGLVFPKMECKLRVKATDAPAPDAAAPSATPTIM